MRRFSIAFVLILVLFFAAGCDESVTGDARNVAKPTVSGVIGSNVESGTEIALECATSGATIYYTLDGSTPSGTSARYENPIAIVKNTVLKAIAVKNGMNTSPVSTYTFNVKTQTPTYTAVSEDDPYKAGTMTVTLSCATPGATIYYTIGTHEYPTTSSAVYTEPIVLTQNGAVNAIAVAEGYEQSDCMTKAFAVKASMPEPDRAGGTYSAALSVSLATKNGNEIHYTTNGDTPTRQSTTYTGPIQITESTVLKAICFCSGMADSDVLTVEYNIRTAVPSSGLKAGTYDSAQTVTLSCADQDATIYYTLDGTNPTTESTVYTGGIEVSYATGLPVTRIKAMAKTDGKEVSDVLVLVYLIKGPAGGYVFYDCDADNDETNGGAGPDKLKSSDCGWRYLEAAPSEIGAESSFIFGFYRTSENGDNLYVNGTTTYDFDGSSDENDGNCTGVAVGTGKANTAKLVAKMGSEAYSTTSGKLKVSDYAAKLCDDYECGGYTDWFLPSGAELNHMDEVLCKKGYGNFCGTYWSSSEYYMTDGSYAWVHSFNTTSDSIRISRDSYARVRAIRSFI